MSFAFAQKPRSRNAPQNKDERSNTLVKGGRSTPATFIQLKAICPCDGGCPSCAPLIQPKLTMGQPHDKYEQEADRIADQVMRAPQEAPLGVMPDSVYPTCTEKKKEDAMQPKGENSAAEEIPHGIDASINSLRGKGQPLSDSVRNYFEPRFGTDFSHVRVHTDAKAADAAKSINSKAFTTGKDIVFGAGQYSPGTATGKHLLGHELCHVVQQGNNSTPTHLQALAEEEKKEDLKSEKYSGNNRLQKAFDNDPSLGIGERGEAVRLVQEGLVADGFAMPRSTKPTGEMDGIFGEETFSVVKRFQKKHFLAVDGVVGHETMGKLDELALARPIAPSPEMPGSMGELKITEKAFHCLEPIDMEKIIKGRFKGGYRMEDYWPEKDYYKHGDTAGPWDDREYDPRRAGANIQIIGRVFGHCGSDTFRFEQVYTSISKDKVDGKSSKRVEQGTEYNKENDNKPPHRQSWITFEDGMAILHLSIADAPSFVYYRKYDEFEGQMDFVTSLRRLEGEREIARKSLCWTYYLHVKNDKIVKNGLDLNAGG